MDSLPEQISARLISFVESLKPKFLIKEAYLFGSWAEDRAHAESDIDIGLVLRGSVKSVDRLELFSLGKDFDIDFDVVAVSERDFETEDPVIVHEMKTKGKRIA
jgi:predicted nucleotidyltransferase